MKNLKHLLLAIIMIASTALTAQIDKPYDKFSIELGGGATKLRDQTSIEFANYEAGFRYMFNTKFGLKLAGNYTNIHDTDLEYQSASFTGVMNAGRVLNFEEFIPWYTVLVGVGGNYAYSEGPINEQIYHRLSNFHLKFDIDNEFKLSNWLFFNVGLDIIPGVNSREYQPQLNATQTTSLLNFNAGLVFSIGKHKEHADWYIQPTRKDTILLKPTVTNNTLVEKHYITNKESFSGHIQFKYDSSEIEEGSQALGVIKDAFVNLRTGQKVILTGYASSENGTNNPDYNNILSNKRANAVKNYFISLGISENSIIIRPKGALDTSDGKNIGLSRSVQIQIQ